jgi:flagellar assembly factor FliW
MPSPIPHDFRLRFPAGLIGCPDWQAFTVERKPEIAPMVLLWSDDQPGLSLPVVNPWLVEPSYAPQLSDADRATLEVADEANLDWLCVLNVQPEGVITANLLGPIALNRSTGQAVQVIQAQSGYSAAHRVGQAQPEAAHAGAHPTA